MHRADIQFSRDGSGTLSFAGSSRSCGGKVGFDYSKDVTVNSSNCYENKHSSEFGVDMKWAVGPVQWRRGAYIHAWGSLLPSAGCIHLYESDAKDFYDYVKSNGPVRIVIAYPW